jgi:hypothetical protein
MPLVIYSPGVDAQTSTSVLFNAIDRKNWIYQPNLVRWRHRNRGPRESLKINQELSQTYYDLCRLSGRLEVVDTYLSFVINHLEEGGLTEGVEYNWRDDATPTNEDMELLGLQSLSAEIESLRKRVEVLED